MLTVRATVPWNVHCEADPEPRGGRCRGYAELASHTRGEQSRGLLCGLPRDDLAHGVVNHVRAEVSAVCRDTGTQTVWGCPC